MSVLFTPEYKIAVEGEAVSQKVDLVWNFQGDHLGDCGLLQKLVTVDSHSSYAQFDLEQLDLKDDASRRKSYQQAYDGFLLVYSVTSRQSFLKVALIRDEILPIKNGSVFRAREGDDEIPMVLVGNCCEREDERQVSKAEAAKVANRWNVPFYETCVPLSINVDECLCELVNKIRKYQTRSKVRQEISAQRIAFLQRNYLTERDLAIATELRFNGQDISDADARVLEDILALGACKTINLGANRIDPIGLDYIAKSLETNFTLAAISFSECNFASYEGNFSSLPTALRFNSTLTSVDFSYCFLTDVRYLANALELNSTITSLNLSNNRIGTLSSGTISKYKRSGEELPECAVKFLADALKVNRTLSTLNISENELGMSAFYYLEEALLVNRTLTSLNLSKNSIDFDTATTLLNSVKLNKGLTSLDLSYMHLNTYSAEAIAELISVNQILSSLSLKGNLFGEHSHLFAEALCRNSTLHSLDLVGIVFKKTRFLAILSESEFLHITRLMIDSETKEEKIGRKVLNREELIAKRMQNSIVGTKNKILGEIELLGQGGFGSVYKTKINGKPFAVKKLFGCDDGILQEISIHQELKHENVVALDSAFFDGERVLNIVMELCHSDIEKFLQAPDTILKTAYKGNLVALAKDWTPQLIFGITYLHSLGVIHRDLKPGNILISIDKYRCVLKYADFGYSKHTGHSATNTYAGTPLYEAPEFWKPLFGKTQESYSNTIDIWSLGIVILQLICLLSFPNLTQLLIRMKFADADYLQRRESLNGLVDRIMSDRPNEIPPDFELLLKKMLVVKDLRSNAIQLFHEPVIQKWMKERELRKEKISKKETGQLVLEIKSKFQIPDGIDFKSSPYYDSALIGQGQFGKVWRCTMLGQQQGNQERVFAIKKLPWDPSDVEQISEILIHKRLKHANVISLHEVFSTPSMVLHIVMDLCDSDLEKYLSDPAQVFSLFQLDTSNSNASMRNNANDFLFDNVSPDLLAHRKVCRALFPMMVDAVRYIHTENVIHRDIKPANILLRFVDAGSSANGVRVIPLLADFGLAKYLTTVSQRAKSFVCSPFWSAPELWSPLGGLIAFGYTKSVDVWSLGIVLLQMWQGLASGNEAIQSKILHQIGANLTRIDSNGIMDLVFSIWPDLSADVSELLSAMLATPNDRASCDSLLKILKKHEWMQVPAPVPQSSSGTVQWKHESLGSNRSRSLGRSTSSGGKPANFLITTPSSNAIHVPTDGDAWRLQDKQAASQTSPTSSSDDLSSRYHPGRPNSPSPSLPSESSSSLSARRQDELLSSRYHPGRPISPSPSLPSESNPTSQQPSISLTHSAPNNTSLPRQFVQPALSHPTAFNNNNNRNRLSPSNPSLQNRNVGTAQPFLSRPNSSNMRSASNPTRVPMPALRRTNSTDANSQLSRSSSQGSLNSQNSSDNSLEYDSLNNS